MVNDTGVWLSLRYDLRAPSFGPPAEAVYRAALEQCAWAEDHGFAMVTLSEHHGSDDGYCPSPLVMAAAVAGRTRELRLLIAALVLPLYDPIRLAEDLAVLDLVSGGRIDLVVRAGYRPEEMAMYDRQMSDRVGLRPRLGEPRARDRRGHPAPAGAGVDPAPLALNCRPAPRGRPTGPRAARPCWRWWTESRRRDRPPGRAGRRRCSSPARPGP
jgi:Luciferase-like monooxygenase